MIREVGRDFGDDPAWYMWHTFPGSDVKIGVATVVADTVNHLYLVHTSSNILQQWTWDYAFNDDGASWQKGVRAETNITAGSDIAAAYDGVSTDHIFYQDTDNQVIRALYYGSGITDFQEIAQATDNSKLSATYDTSSSNNGATIFYQPSNNTKAVEYQTTNRSGQELRSGIVE